MPSQDQLQATANAIAELAISPSLPAKATTTLESLAVEIQIQIAEHTIRVYSGNYVDWCARCGHSKATELNPQHEYEAYGLRAGPWGEGNYYNPFWIKDSIDDTGFNLDWTGNLTSPIDENADDDDGGISFPYNQLTEDTQADYHIKRAKPRADDYLRKRVVCTDDDHGFKRDHVLKSSTCCQEAHDYSDGGFRDLKSLIMVNRKLHKGLAGVLWRHIHFEARTSIEQAQEKLSQILVQPKPWLKLEDIRVFSFHSKDLDTIPAGSYDQLADDLVQVLHGMTGLKELRVSIRRDSTTNPFLAVLQKSITTNTSNLANSPVEFLAFTWPCQFLVEAFSNVKKVALLDPVEPEAMEWARVKGENYGLEEEFDQVFKAISKDMIESIELGQSWLFVRSLEDLVKYKPDLKGLHITSGVGESWSGFSDFMEASERDFEPLLNSGVRCVKFLEGIRLFSKLEMLSIPRSHEAGLFTIGQVSPEDYDHISEHLINAEVEAAIADDTTALTQKQYFTLYVPEADTEPRRLPRADSPAAIEERRLRKLWDDACRVAAFRLANVLPLLKSVVLIHPKPKIDYRLPYSTDSRRDIKISIVRQEDSKAVDFQIDYGYKLALSSDGPLPYGLGKVMRVQGKIKRDYARGFDPLMKDFIGGGGWEV